MPNKETWIPSPSMRTMVTVVLLLVVCPLSFPPAGVQAADGDINVTTTADEYGSGSDCSLREAIEAANTDTAFGGCIAGSGNDTIRLPSGTYTLTRAGVNEDANASGDLDIHSNLVIMGEGSGASLIDAARIDRVVQVHNGSVRFYRLAITGGQAPHGNVGFDAITPGENGGPGGSGEDGGGIDNNGSLKLEYCDVYDNKAGNGGSGGDGATGSTGNSAPGGAGGNGGKGGGGGYGGGIYNRGIATLWLLHTTVRDNQAGSAADGGKGGLGGAGDTNFSGGDGGHGGDGGFGSVGGAVHAWNGSLTLIGSELLDNQAGDGGHGGAGGNGRAGTGLNASGGDGGSGGIGGYGGDGGGLYARGDLSISASTVSGNQAGHGGNGGPGGSGANLGGKGGDGAHGANGGSGGGLCLVSGSDTTIEDSLIDGNNTGRGGHGGTGGSGATGKFSRSGGQAGQGAFAGPGGDGAGVFVTQGILTLDNTTVSNNVTGEGGDGGDGGKGGKGGTGLSSNGGTGGAGGPAGNGGSGGDGGGIWSSEDLTIVDSLIQGNQTGDGRPAGAGGDGGSGGTGGSGFAGGDGGSGGTGAVGGVGGSGAGIYVYDGSPMQMTSTTVHDNGTGNGGNGGHGGDGGSGGAGGAMAANNPADVPVPGANSDGASGGNAGRGGHGGGLARSGTDFWGITASTISANSTGSGARGGDGGDAGTNASSATGTGGDGGHGGPAGSGGGIANSGALYIDNTTLSGNEAGAGGTGGNGGSGSVSDGMGGSGGQGGRGGGISNWATVAVARMANSTIINNLAIGDGGDPGTGEVGGSSGGDGRAGGIYSDVLNSFFMGHTIVALNYGLGPDDDCDATISSNGYNWIRVASGCTLQGDGGTTVFGTDPDLGLLADNGGPTQTHLPQPSSPVLDSGDTTCNDSYGVPLTSDQRGWARPADYDGDSISQCDRGAVEVYPDVTLDVVVTGSGDGKVASLPPGINCGEGSSDCSKDLELGTAVTLAAYPAATWAFQRWSGGCSGAEPVCQLTLDASTVVTASFGLPLSRVHLPLIVR